ASLLSLPLVRLCNTLSPYYLPFLLHHPSSPHIPPLSLHDALPISSSLNPPPPPLRALRVFVVKSHPRRRRREESHFNRIDPHQPTRTPHPSPPPTPQPPTPPPPPPQHPPPLNPPPPHNDPRRITTT